MKKTKKTATKKRPKKTATPKTPLRPPHPGKVLSPLAKELLRVLTKMSRTRNARPMPRRELCARVSLDWESKDDLQDIVIALRQLRRHEKAMFVGPANSNDSGWCLDE